MTRRRTGGRSRPWPTTSSASRCHPTTRTTAPSSPRPTSRARTSPPTVATTFEGRHTGLGFTEGQNGFAPVYRLTNVRFSPNYAVDGTIFTAGFTSVLKSTDRGGSWQALAGRSARPHPAAVRHRRVAAVRDRQDRLRRLDVRHDLPIDERRRSSLDADEERLRQGAVAPDEPELPGGQGAVRGHGERGLQERERRRRLDQGLDAPVEAEHPRHVARLRGGRHGLRGGGQRACTSPGIVGRPGTGSPTRRRRRPASSRPSPSPPPSPSTGCSS